jgi:hypothetical protein
MVSNSATGITERQTEICSATGTSSHPRWGRLLSGFRATGIVPLDSQVFSEEYLLPTVAIDRETQSELQERGQVTKSTSTYGDSVSQDAG